MRELLVATNNDGKLREIRKLFENSQFSVIGLAEAGITHDVEEVGETFEGNAIIKAMTYGHMSGKLTLSEDSGLEIDALAGKPGVYTKRYAEGTPDHGHARIIGELENVPDKDRGAQFRSVIAVYDPVSHKIRLCEGVARGSITHEPMGTNGFGQDPIFRYDATGKTGGEMSLEEKNAISHRAKALTKAKEILLKEFI